MANPQPDQFTKLSNEIVEALARFRIPGEVMQVTIWILRNTYGWNKKTAVITLGSYALGTSMKKPSIIRALNKGQEHGIIYKRANNEWGFQKDFDKWKPFTKKLTFTKKLKIIDKKANKSFTKELKITDELKTYKDNKETIVIDVESSGKKPLTSIQKIVELLKRLKEWNDPDWNDKHFGRHTKAAKELLRVCKQDAADAEACLHWVAEECKRKGLDWTIETAINKEPDYRAQVKKTTNPLSDMSNLYQQEGKSVN